MEALYKISRTHHQKHLTQMMPYIAGMFFFQIFIMHQAYPQEDLGNYTLFCAFTIISYVFGNYLYDEKIETLVFKDRIETDSLFLGRIIIPIHKIKSVVAPSSEVRFGSLILVCAERHTTIKYVNEPAKVKALIESVQIDLVRESVQDAA